MRWLAVFGVLAAQPALATPLSGLDGGVGLHYELAGFHDVQERMPVPTKELVLAQIRLHAFVGKGRVGYHIGLDFGAGSTIRAGGFAYDVALLPVGIAMRLGETSVIALGAGIGASGAVGTLDDALTLPIEMSAELGGGRMRVITRIRASYIAAASARQHGAPSAKLADELEAMLGVRIGRHYNDLGFPAGNGYFVGVSYREMLGARFAGVVIGYSIDMATPRR